MKEIAGYEGLYSITKDGRVWGHKRKKFLSPGSDKYGYLKVNLCKDGKLKPKLIHRLVAEAYIPNPNNLPEVNHINEDKTKNEVSNLEWCTRSYNINYGTCIPRRASHLYKAVYCVELDRTFESIARASAELGIKRNNISYSLNRRVKSKPGSGEYTWRFVE